MQLIYAAGLLVTLVIISLLRWYGIYFRYKKHLKRFNELYHFPFLGFMYYIRNTTDLYNKLLDDTLKAGRNFFTMLSVHPMFVTSDPKLFSLILKSSKHINKSSVYQIINKYMGDTIILSNGDAWREQRQTFNPAFDYSLLIHNVSLFNRPADELVGALKSEERKENCDILTFAQKYSFKVTHDTLFGVKSAGDLGELSDSLSFLINRALERNLRISEYFDITYFFTRNYWKERKALEYVFGHLRNVLENRKLVIKSRQIEISKPIFTDIILREMELNQKDSDENYLKQLAMMLGAGFGTTAYTISYILYSLSKNPNVQEKVYKEVDTILGNNVNQSVTYEHLKEMKYLDLVIKESLRLYTTVPFYARELHEDVVFDDTVLPKGTGIMFLPFVMHRDPGLYRDPEKFIPERFLSQNVSSFSDRFAPFCIGARQCLGKRFAELSIKVAVAKVLMHYELVDIKHELCLAAEITLVSKSGIKISIKERKGLLGCCC